MPRTRQRPGYNLKQVDTPVKSLPTAASIDWFAPTLDRQGAMDLAVSRTALLEKHADEVIAALANFMDRLTPSQKQQLRELIEAKMQRWHR